MRRVACLVVGGGVAGSATAWWLSRKGHEVVLLEQFEQGHARGSSHGPVRIFRFVYPVADYVRLAREALGLWQVAETDSGETLVDLTGGIDFGDPESLGRISATLDAEGVDYEMLSESAAAGRFPGFRFEGNVLFQPQGGRCYAERAVAAFQRVASSNGAEVRFQEPALSVEESGGKALVRTATDEYVADVCIVAAGSWVQRLAGGHFALPELRVTREQPAYFASRLPPTAWPSFINHGGAGGGAFASYGLYSPGLGLKVGVHMGGAEVDPDLPADEADDAATNEVARVAAGLLPGVEARPLHVERCLYTTTPNEDFVIERSGPIVVASPCSGHGFKFGPAIGKMVAEFALGHSEPLERFRLR